MIVQLNFQVKSCKFKSNDLIVKLTFCLHRQNIMQRKWTWQARERKKKLIDFTLDAYIKKYLLPHLPDSSPPVKIDCEH